MKEVKTIISLGIVVALVPFLGFPSSWKNIVFLLLGLGIALTAFRLYLVARSVEELEESEHASFQQSAIPDTEMVVSTE